MQYRPIDVASLVNDALAHATGAQPDRTRWTQTGLHDFDRRYGGLAPGTLTVIGARPGMGATSLARTIAANVLTSSSDARVLVYSPDCTARQLTLDFLARIAKVDRHRINTGETTEQDAPHLASAREVLVRPGRMLVANSSDHDLDILRMQAHRVAARAGGLGLLVVESLGSMLPGEAPQERAEQLEPLVERLKQLAVDVDVPILAGVPVHPDVDARTLRRPRPHDLIGSRAINRHADCITMLYRPEYYAGADAPLEWQGKAEWIVARHAWLQPGSMVLGYLARYGLFVNLSGKGRA